MSLIDRCLQEVQIARKIFPAIEDFAFFTDHSGSEAEILNTEKGLLGVQNFRLSRPLQVTFLRHLTTAAAKNLIPHNMAGYFLKLTLLVSSFSATRPTLLAAAGLYLHVTGFGYWSTMMPTSSGYTDEDLKPLAKKIAEVLKIADSGMRQSIRSKLSIKKVALFPGLKLRISRFLGDHR